MCNAMQTQEKFAANLLVQLYQHTIQRDDISEEQVIISQVISC